MRYYEGTDKKEHTLPLKNLNFNKTSISNENFILHASFIIIKIGKVILKYQL